MLTTGQTLSIHPLSCLASNLPWSIKIFTALPCGCCPLRRSPFYYLVCMHTHSLIPKTKTTVIGLGVRLVHMGNCVLIRIQSQSPIPTSFYTIVVHIYLHLCIIPTVFALFFGRLSLHLFTFLMFLFTFIITIGSGRYILMIFSSDFSAGS